MTRRSFFKALFGKFDSVKSVEKLEVKPNTVILVKSDPGYEPLSDEDVQRIRDVFAGNHVVVLDGVTVQVAEP